MTPCTLYTAALMPSLFQSVVLLTQKGEKIALFLLRSCWNSLCTNFIFAQERQETVHAVLLWVTTPKLELRIQRIPGEKLYQRYQCVVPKRTVQCIPKRTVQCIRGEKLWEREEATTVCQKDAKS